jgi:hypothetical protein
MPILGDESDRSAQGDGVGPRDAPLGAALVHADCRHRPLLRPSFEECIEKTIPLAVRRKNHRVVVVKVSERFVVRKQHVVQFLALGRTHAFRPFDLDRAFAVNHVSTLPPSWRPGAISINGSGAVELEG